jgi:5-(carboxyamino)imidazole ribonucleotide synthase
MLADAIARLGARPLLYEPDLGAPARLRVADAVAAPFDDLERLREFFGRCDIVTYEREDLPVDALRVAGAGTCFVPNLDVLALAQDRAQEKSFFVKSGLPCVRFAVVRAGEPLADASAAFGFPSIAKTTRGGYDGKGQFLVRTKEDAAAAEASFPHASWVLEEPVAIRTEASCIVARSLKGEEVAFPVVENFHRDHVLDRSLVPSRLTSSELDRIRNLAHSAARALDVRGLVAVEFFLVGDPDGSQRILLNELAPRPHNSGHVFSRACSFGQFDALARILVGAPLGVPSLGTDAFCMGNLLGDVWLAQGRESAIDLSAWSDFPDVIEVHLYGKREPAQRRKMGHFVVQEKAQADALARAEAFRAALTKRSDKPEMGVSPGRHPVG